MTEHLLIKANTKETIPDTNERSPVLPKNTDLSLVCFTLLIQSAIGLIWVGTTASILTDAKSLGHAFTALALIALGLASSLSHLARPRQAPNALRNLAASWLSREVLLVHLFGGAVFLIIPASLLTGSTGRIVVEFAACILGATALFAMTRVYLLKTVPVWKSPATSLEFTGSALLLGGAVAALLIAFKSGQSLFKMEMTAAGIAIFLGLVLKVMAMPLAFSARKAADDQTWYKLSAPYFSIGRIWAFRMGLNLTGLLLLPIAIGGDGLNGAGACLCLLCFVIGEIVGRLHFYNAYTRIGL